MTTWLARCRTSRPTSVAKQPPHQDNPTYWQYEMYVPAVNRIDADDDVRALVARVGSAQFVTTGPDGFPDATLLPVVWRGDTVIAHMARANPQWQNLDRTDQCLLI